MVEVKNISDFSLTSKKIAGFSSGQFMSYGGQEYMVKPADKIEFVDFSKPEEAQKTNSQRDAVLNEFLIGGTYKYLLADNAPEIGLAIDDNKIYLTSKKIANLENFDQSQNTSQVKGFAKAIAVADFLAEQDTNVGNNWLANSGAIKIDHGLSGFWTNNFSKQQILIRNASNLENGYQNFPLNINEYQQEVSKLAKMNDSQLNEMSEEIAHRINILERTGFILSDDFNKIHNLGGIEDRYSNLTKFYEDNLRRSREVFADFSEYLEIVAKIDGNQSYKNGRWLLEMLSDSKEVLDPIVSAMANNRLIEGKHPITWAKENNHLINGKSAEEYYLDFNKKLTSFEPVMTLDYLISSKPDMIEGFLQNNPVNSIKTNSDSLFELAMRSENEKVINLIWQNGGDLTKINPYVIENISNPVLKDKFKLLQKLEAGDSTKKSISTKCFIAYMKFKYNPIICKEHLKAIVLPHKKTDELDKKLDDQFNNLFLKLSEKENEIKDTEKYKVELKEKSKNSSYFKMVKIIHRFTSLLNVTTKRDLLITDIKRIQTSETKQAKKKLATNMVH